jgi:hypothetical protein
MLETFFIHSWHHCEKARVFVPEKNIQQRFICKSKAEPTPFRYSTLGFVAIQHETERAFIDKRSSLLARSVTGELKRVQ